MIILSAVHGPDKGRVLMLPESRRHVIGRHRLSLADRQVSRKHARLEKYDGQWFIEDLGSTNGTLVNGHQLTEPVTLAPGDRVRVGQTEFMFATAEAPAPQALVTFTPTDERSVAQSTTLAEGGADSATLTMAESVSPVFETPRPTLAPFAFAALSLVALFMAVGMVIESTQANVAKRPVAEAPAAANVAPLTRPPNADGSPNVVTDQPLDNGQSALDRALSAIDQHLGIQRDSDDAQTPATASPSVDSPRGSTGGDE